MNSDNPGIIFLEFVEVFFFVWVLSNLYKLLSETPNAFSDRTEKLFLQPSVVC